ncbi:MAG: serine hydrolase domain-containing protein [Beijerinckiaceae bacterium]
MKIASVFMAAQQQERSGVRDLQRLEQAADAALALVQPHLDDGRIPGAVLGLITRDGIKAVRAAGLAQRVPSAMPMRQDTVFDLASLTKVIFTTPSILRLVSEGRITLDDPLARHIPDLRQYDLKAPERALTIAQCLTHQTFLPAVEPVYTYAKDPLSARAFILQRAWAHGPAVYSDINFILLGVLIERVTGASLAQQPLPAGMTFHPAEAACAATEMCTWRNRIMRGQVHDENAFALGGASGHAGLFGDAEAVLNFSAALLRHEVLPPALTDALFVRRSAQRALGWEIKYDNWSGGAACSDETIGHTGFTGTGLWIDRQRGLAWTLLTNRVHPSRHTDSGIVPLRRAVGNAVISAFDS